MPKILNGSRLTPAEKQNIQQIKNKIINFALICFKHYNLTSEQMDIIFNVVISLTMHRVGSYEDRIRELTKIQYILQGIQSLHISQTNSSSIAQEATSPQPQQMMTPQPQQMMTPQPQQEPEQDPVSKFKAFFAAYNDYT